MNFSCECVVPRDVKLPPFAFANTLALIAVGVSCFIAGAVASVIIARFGRAWKVSAVRAASAVQTSMKSSVLFNICFVAFVSLVAQSNLIGFGKEDFEHLYFSTKNHGMVLNKIYRLVEGFFLEIKVESVFKKVRF